MPKNPAKYQNREQLIDSLKVVSQPKETKRLWADAEYLKNIWFSSNVGVIIINANKQEIADANPFTIKLIGIPKEEVIGRICCDFICTIGFEKCLMSNFRKILGSSECFLICTDRKKIPIIKTVVQVIENECLYLIEIFVLAKKQKVVKLNQ